VFLTDSTVLFPLGDGADRVRVLFARGLLVLLRVEALEREFGLLRAEALERLLLVEAFEREFVERERWPVDFVFVWAIPALLSSRIPSRTLATRTATR
jgi:hypothetical protein